MKKKFFALIAVLVFAVAFAVPAFAASGITAAEQALLDEFKAGYVVDGVKVVPPARYVATAEKALMERDLSEAQVSEIKSVMRSVFAEMKENKLTTGSEILSYSNYKGLVSKIQKLAKKYDYVAEPLGVTLAPVGGKGGTIKQTGFDMSATIVIALASVLALGGSAAVIRRKGLLAE